MKPAHIPILLGALVIPGGFLLFAPAVLRWARQRYAARRENSSIFVRQQTLTAPLAEKI